MSLEWLALVSAFFMGLCQFVVRDSCPAFGNIRV